MMPVDGKMMAGWTYNASQPRSINVVSILINEFATQLAKLRDAGLGFILHCVGVFSADSTIGWVGLARSCTVTDLSLID